MCVINKKKSIKDQRKFPPNAFFKVFAISVIVFNSWSKTRIFTASTITQHWLDNTIIMIYFSINATIIYWMKETNSCFLGIATKAPVRIHQNLYTAFEWIWQSNLQIEWFAFRRWQTQLAARASHNDSKNNYYIRPHLDARRFFYTGGFPPPWAGFKLFLFTPVFSDK